MLPKTKKRISRIAVVGAFIMALSCTVKITAFHFNLPLVSQWVNVIMNAIIVCGCYELGRIAELSRSHRLLCGTAMLGYILYSFILMFFQKSTNEGVSLSVLLFFMLTLIMSVWFLIDLVRSDLKQTEIDLEQLEKEIDNEEY